MPPLADLQQAFAQALMTDGAVPAAIRGILRPDEAMRIHRNTVLGALVTALRLSHPTVDALVGEAFFDQAAGAFARTQPPRTACLSLYGDSFADFLAGFAPTLPYLGEVARLDFAIERALHTDGTRRFALDETVAITLHQSLTVLTLRYPADEIRAAIGDDAALAAITFDPAERHLLVWRQDTQAHLHTVAAASGIFLRQLLAGAPAAIALAAAGEDQATTLQQLQSEIFNAPFCAIISNPEGYTS